MQFFWVLPSLAECQGQRNLRQVTRTLEQLGYDGIHLPAGRRGEDCMVLGATLAAVTERLILLVGIRPAALPASVLARMAASLHAVSDGRLMLHLASRLYNRLGATVGASAAQSGHRVDASEDFMRQWWEAYRVEWSQLQNQSMTVTPSRSYPAPVRPSDPAVSYGGLSDASGSLAAELADLYFVPPRPPTEMALRVAKLRAQAVYGGRNLRFALRVHVVIREAYEEAGRAARVLFDSASKSSMLASPPRRKQQYVVSSNLWVHDGLARDGAQAALVGEPLAVAARLREYARLGIDTFVLSGYPHGEEAARVAKLLFPLLGSEMTNKEDFPLWPRRMATAA
jgi:alkanesulfonate monooxygenase